MNDKNKIQSRGQKCWKGKRGRGLGNKQTQGWERSNSKAEPWACTVYFASYITHMLHILFYRSQMYTMTIF